MKTSSKAKKSKKGSVIEWVLLLCPFIVFGLVWFMAIDMLL